MDVTSILEVNHVKIKCYVIGLCVMFTYAFLSHFMDSVYSLMNEGVNQFTVTKKDKYKLKSLACCMWFIYALHETVTSRSIEQPCMLRLAHQHEQC